MKKILFLFLFMVPELMAVAQPNMAVVTGKVKDATTKTITIEWLRDNQIAGIQKTYHAPVNAKGEFTLKIPLQQFAHSQITAGNFHHDIFLSAGAAISAQIDGDFIKYTGKGAAANNFLYALEKANLQNSNYYEDFNAGKLSPQAYATETAIFKEKRIKFLADFVKKQPVEQLFKDFFLAENEAIYRNNLMEYPARYAYYNNIKLEQVPLSPEYILNSSLKHVANDKYILSDIYVSSLRTLVPYKGIELMKANLVKVNPESVFSKILLDSLTGKTREYVMANWLCGEFSRDKLPNDLYATFKSIAKDSFAIKTVAAYYNNLEKKRALIGKPLHEEFKLSAVENTKGEKLDFGKMMEKYKGKVIYLDMWDLACAPCREEMPYAKKLKEKFKGQPVEFIYLTLDEKSDKLWEQVYKVTQTEENQYRLQNGFQSRLFTFMNMNWVPSYMIFDKEGKLVDYVAPRPSNRGLEKQLLELANK